MFQQPIKKISITAKNARGFSFVELVISIVVIGIAVTGLLLVFTQTVASSADPLIRQQALAIAEAYLEEVISKHYDDPDGAADVGGRAGWDDIGDYDGLTGAPTRPDGSTVGLDGLSTYTVSVTVSAPLALGPGGNTAVAREVIVSVSHGGSTILSLSSFRTDYSP